ncbi:hypothetical protein Salat_1850500 [Sesamum alatum]|uniref:Secreted protein n=1 Tax=Sesamum alatum TaxID=300844 RepID=A0AAE1Y2P6_9LAMI|nr:hypothetical protein Salat_1850500 [Sesamum alatum]
MNRNNMFLLKLTCHLLVTIASQVQNLRPSSWLTIFDSSSRLQKIRLCPSAAVSRSSEIRLTLAVAAHGFVAFFVDKSVAVAVLPTRRCHVLRPFVGRNSGF